MEDVPDSQDIKWEKVEISKKAKCFKTFFIFILVIIILTLLVSLSGLFIFFSSISNELLYNSKTYYNCHDSESFDSTFIYNSYENIINLFKSVNSLMTNPILLEFYMTNMRMYYCYCQTLNKSDFDISNYFLRRCLNTKNLETFGTYGKLFSVPVFIFLLFIQKFAIMKLLKKLPFEVRTTIKSIQMIILLLMFCVNFWVIFYLI